MGTQRPDFAEFYRRSRDDCLRTVLVSVGNRDTAKDLVAARACADLPFISGGKVPAIAVGIVDASPHCTGS